MRNRTIARELALQALYQLDLRGDGIFDEVDTFCKKNTDKPDIYRFAILLVDGCRSHLKEIDEKISSVTEHWELHRMAIIDKNILRLGVYELLYRDDIPPNVSDPVFQNIVEVNYGNSDLHIHTNYSDGTMTPEEVVDEALLSGVSTIAITDHDTIEGVGIALRYGNNKNLNIIPGIELSSYLSPSEVHILGYFIDIHNTSLQKMLKRAHEDRLKRIYTMVEKLHNLNVDINAEEILTLAGKGSPGRMHVAEVIWKHGYCSTILEAFLKYIGDNGPAYVPKKTFTPREAIELIKEAHGASVLAHPGLTQRDHIIEDLVKDGLQGIEVYYPAHSPQTIKKYLKIAEKYDLAVTGGSDFHGERKIDTPIAKVTVPEEFVHKLRQKCSSQ
ncbi:MAG: PHP domain-containing protein [Candidatus Jettenia caeni]|nr:PHP domain-containing protein [Candidatus Jettenia caeni]